MNILVTGANGQLAQCLKSIVEENTNGHSDHFVGEKNYYIFKSREELDITDSKAVSEFVSKNHINVIVNCAAYTNVNNAQTEQQAAYAVNATGPKNLANAAASVGAVLIHISTDYVFSNTKVVNTPLPPYNFFVQHDEPGYSQALQMENYYGYSKLVGEKQILNSGCRYLIFRTSWLYSIYGKNFVKTIAQKINDGSDINVVYDQVGSPTSAHDLARFIYHIIEDNNDETRYLSKQGIYNFANKGVASWYDVAENISNILLGKVTITPCRSSEFPQPVVRPSYSVLDTTLTSENFDFNIEYWVYSLFDVVNNLFLKK